MRTADFAALEPGQTQKAAEREVVLDRVLRIQRGRIEHAEVPRVLAVAPVAVDLGLDRVEAFIGAEIRQRGVPEQIGAVPATRKLRVVTGIETQAPQHAARIELDIGQGRVADLESRLAGAAIGAQPELADRSDLRAQVEAQFGFRDPVARNRIFAGEDIQVALPEVDPRRNKQARLGAEGLIKLGQQLRVGSELQVGLPFRAPGIDTDFRQTRPDIERG